MPLKRTPAKGRAEADEINQDAEQEEYGSERREANELDALDPLDDDDLTPREEAMKERLEFEQEERHTLSEKLEHMMQVVNAFQDKQEKNDKGIKNLTCKLKGKKKGSESIEEKQRDESLIACGNFEKLKEVKKALEKGEGSRLAAFYVVYDEPRIEEPKLIATNSKWLTTSPTPNKGNLESVELLNALKASQAYALEIMKATAHAFEDVKHAIDPAKWQMLRMLYRRNMGVLSGTHKLITCGKEKRSAETAKFTACIFKDIKQAKKNADPYLQMIDEQEQTHEKRLDQAKFFEAIKKSFTKQKISY